MDTGTNSNEFYNFALDIAAHLDGGAESWSVYALEQTAYPVVVMERMIDGFDIELTLGGYRKKGRVTVGMFLHARDERNLGQFRYSYSDGAMPEITFADTTDAASAAKQIKNRFMIAAQAYFKELTEREKNRKDYDEVVTYNSDLLQAMGRGAIRLVNHTSGSKSKLDFYFGMGVYGDLEVMRDSVNMKISVPLELAGDIVRAIADYKSKYVEGKNDTGN